MLCQARPNHLRGWPRAHSRLPSLRRRDRWSIERARLPGVLEHETLLPRRSSEVHWPHVARVPAVALTIKESSTPLVFPEELDPDLTPPTLRGDLDD